MSDIDTTPYTHPVVSGMDEAALVARVEIIRDKRLRLAEMYKEVVRIKKGSSEMSLQGAIDKQLVHFDKALAKVDKALEGAMDRANKIIALQLQLGVDVDVPTRLISILKGETK